MIITALEEERDAVLTKLDYRRLEKDGRDTHTYYEAEVRSERSDAASYRVIVTSLAGMGPIMAAQKAQAVVARWHPRNVLLVGIACGIPGKTSLGDVLVSTQVADYVLGKVHPDGTRDIRWAAHPAGPNLLDAALNLAPREWTDLISQPRPKPGQPVRHGNVIASGGDVVSSAELIRAYQKQWSKLVGIEMEAGGVASGLLNTPDRPEFLMIKGVSDHGEGKQTVEEWRPYASDAAASFALALIRAGIGPPIRRKRRLVAAVVALLSAGLAISFGIGWIRSERAAEARRLTDRGVAALKNGQDQQAREAFGAALKLDAADARAHSQLALLDSREGRLQRAVEHAQVAATRAPHEALYHYNLGVLLARTNRLEEALQSLLRAIALDPASVHAYNELGNVYLTMKRPADARRALSQGLRRDPAFPQLSKNLARAAIAEGRPAEAVQLLKGVQYPASDWQGRAEVAYWLAVAETGLQNRTGSCNHLARVREIDPHRLSAVAPDAQRLGRSHECDPWR